MDDDRRDLWFRLGIAGLLGVIAGAAVFGAYWLRYEPDPAEPAVTEDATVLVQNGAGVDCAAANAAAALNEAGFGSVATGNTELVEATAVSFVRGQRPVAGEVAGLLGLEAITPQRMRPADDIDVLVVLGPDHAPRLADLATC